MSEQMRAMRAGDEDNPRDSFTRQAIIALMQARDMHPGDSVNISQAQFEMERKGIDITEFSIGVVTLLDNGLLDMRGNAFYLTDAGFQAVRHDKGQACA